MLDEMLSLALEQARNPVLQATRAKSARSTGFSGRTGKIGQNARGDTCEALAIGSSQGGGKEFLGKAGILGKHLCGLPMKLDILEAVGYGEYPNL